MQLVLGAADTSATAAAAAVHVKMLCCAVLQQLFMQPKIRGGVLGAAEVVPEQQSESVFAQLQVSLSATHACTNQNWWLTRCIHWMPTLDAPISRDESGLVHHGSCGPW
jgi:hypothetical protein